MPRLHAQWRKKGKKKLKLLFSFSLHRDADSTRSFSVLNPSEPTQTPPSHHSLHPEPPSPEPPHSSFHDCGSYFSSSAAVSVSVFPYPFPHCSDSGSETGSSSSSQTDLSYSSTFSDTSCRVTSFPETRTEHAPRVTSG
jgi:hypothetical protein